MDDPHSPSPASGVPRSGSAGDYSDTSPGFEKIDDVPGLPRVLLIGDSISVGYTLGVRRRLDGVANVHRIPENGGPTSRGRANIDSWLGDGCWDLIHFNWGLHDLIVMEDGRRQVPIDDYAANLRFLVNRMSKTGATLVWCSTTPVPPGELTPVRKVEDALAYNAIARSIMEEDGIRIHDLHAFVLPRIEQIQQHENVHFTEEGSDVLAEQVAKAIEGVLRERG